MGKIVRFQLKKCNVNYTYNLIVLNTGYDDISFNYLNPWENGQNFS